MNADKKTVKDRNEDIAYLEPMLIREQSPKRAAFIDAALELATSSASFHHSLPQGIATALCNLVRSMNCYYSNLIEGHYTHPIDIERALHDDYSDNQEKRDLQQEARAYIAVQQWIDKGGLQQRANTTHGIREIHRRFTELLPDSLCWVKKTNDEKSIKVVPGEFRQEDVVVGRHVAVSPGAIPRFLQRFEEVYNSLGKSQAIIAAAAAHHRFLWIHPFLDGNGRVARLMSHATFLEVLDTGGLWSIARGLARSEQAYKNHLSACDLKRRNDLDGRGHLSEESLIAFTEFFLTTCLDQIKFMANLVQPRQLHQRILQWCKDEVRQGNISTKAEKLLTALLYQGELARNEVANVLDLSERQARRILATLMQYDIITSDHNRAPLRLAFPAKLAPRWMPGLFPEKPE